MLLLTSTAHGTRLQIKKMMTDRHHPVLWKDFLSHVSLLFMTGYATDLSHTYKNKNKLFMVAFRVHCSNAVITRMMIRQVKLLLQMQSIVNSGILFHSTGQAAVADAGGSWR
jgi:hypothetical protein